ncbi:molybdopterin-guanine dinucleotide biosynthesis protein B [Candidatus Aminicenantes bacterium AC-335-B20]|jgi:molybdopterin-guanine dinucleotide biosynthesis protein B|nr:molybdopterin-guanine dinucleotide biosynthesis protein B [SCandidatus Aminicenantes bacterium Aminicenantia_JdfR_composite]MCP2596333.1 molybdopterin-guanine dinucleotide biosynthesis protein B [Candidatus Aminicenantes bacterium AC-335-G13]MCP2599141.1 molybdopterin-guanine dinucleotide biosynthesis protein B [Candidatus Aminicenantes bacterium AC-335-B20]MCP2605426.1 molybdopterin-guanine dinucleotide biosynthesis protein B [Candidatus Aminicenantes bacterium AC-335-O07]MCP2617808.1 molyb
MIPVFSFIGESKSGKTSIIEKVIKELKNRGYKVGIIKHSCCDFEINKKEKDTRRFQDAGADSVAFSSRDKFFLFRKNKEEVSIKEIIEKYFDDVDIILTEGYSREKFPKIVISKEVKEENLIYDNLIAVVCEKQINKRIPVFTFNQINELVDFLLRRVNL